MIMVHKYSFFLLFFLYNTFPLYISNKNLLEFRKISKNSEITMIIYGNGNGTQEIFNYYLTNDYKPSEVFINGKKESEIKRNVSNLINGENEIILKWDSLFTSCDGMFLGLYNIRKIDLSNFDSSKVTGMRLMFSGCILLASINFSNFDTSLVTDMEYLFYKCHSLISLDLSSFNTILVEQMDFMFYNCYSLISLNLNSFNTSFVTNMRYMFYNCQSLTSLELKNFNTSLVTNMGSMFYNCSSLTSLNLSNFETSSQCDVSNMFDNCNNELIFCVNDKSNGENMILKQLTNSSYNNNCSYLCFVQSKKYIFEKEKCFINCYDDNDYKYEYNNKCYSSCPNGTIISSNNDYLCEKETQTIITNINDIYSDKYDNIETNIFTEINSIVPNININYFQNLCRIKDNSTSKDDIIRKIRIEFNNGNLDTLINYFIEGKKDDLIAYGNDITYQISSIYNQKNNEYINISTIDLGECETKIRNYYNISKNTTLLIFKIEIKREGLLFPITEYEVYNLETKEKINLSICEDLKIYLSVPVFVDENNLFKYNLSSKYYNDICYPYTTIYKTDIILKDRINEFYNNNLSLCEEDCEYQAYNINTKKALCKCFIKINLPLISEISINKDKLLKKMDLKETVNLSILKCYKLVFSKEGLVYNMGSYIFLLIILIIILLAIIFRIKGYKMFIKKLNKIIKIIINNNNINHNNNINKKIKKIVNKKDLNNNKEIKKPITFNKNKKGTIRIKNNFKNTKKQNPPIKKMKRFKNSSNNIMKNNDTISNSHIKLQNPKFYINVKKKKNYNISIFNINKTCTQKNIKINNSVHSITYNDYELNHLPYQKALEIDKRKYIDYYISLLKTKHLLIFTFFTNDDYNSPLIKLSLFLFSFALLYTVSALFFTDSTIHKIYEDNGSFDFIYQIPQVFYSFIISSTINIIIKYLSLSEKSIIGIKYEKENIKEKFSKVRKFLIIKFILFFILIFLFLIFFWYYLSCFCAVYHNSQIHLIKDVFLSFGLHLLYPFGLSLLPGIFRIPSLNNNVQKKRECLYNLSKIFQLII